MTYKIRTVRSEEWPAAKALRLVALRDPVASLAFLESFEEAGARPDSFYQERTAGAAEGAERAQQIIAEGPDGEWVATVTMLREEAGSVDWAGCLVEREQGHVVGVFVRPEVRGIGLTEVLFDAALEWAWGRGAERVRLIVHEDNARAQRFYRKIGFEPTGVPVPLAAQLEMALERP